MKVKSFFVFAVAATGLGVLGYTLYPIVSDVIRPIQPEVVSVSPSVQHLLEPVVPVATPPTNEPLLPVETEPVAETAPVPAGSDQTIPSRFTIVGVPFLSQAPSANWDLPYQEACEEASVIMVNRFYTKKPLGAIEEQDTLIVEMTAWGDEHLGAVDTNVAVTSRYFAEYIGLSADRISVVYDMTIDDIKAVLASGKPVIIPAAGRELGNPYFMAPGPLYHMLVIIGYDEDEFIAHDPGTRRGEAFRYKQNVLFSAIHDLPSDKEHILDGRKAMIVVSPPSA